MKKVLIPFSKTKILGNLEKYKIINFDLYILIFGSFYYSYIN